MYKPAFLVAAFLYVVPGTAGAQTTAASRPADPPPATRLEAFKPAAGTLVTVAYDELGQVSGISVDVREIRAERAGAVRGVVVQVRESQYREERSFVDADEVPELLRGIDALLDIGSNPTSFQNFEVQYTTKGELQITAFNDARGGIRYAVRAGRAVSARTFVDAAELRRLRGMIEAAGQRLQ